MSGLFGIAKTAMGSGKRQEAERISKQTKTSPADVVSFYVIALHLYFLSLDGVTLSN